MPSGADADKAARRAPQFSGDRIEEPKSYRVVLEGLGSEIETVESFAIKFSLLTKTPLSKTKHYVKRLPAVIWMGQGRSSADRILALLEEAGGSGAIVEIDTASPVTTAGCPKSKAACRWCGFPMKEGESVCGFCRTPVEGAERSAPPPKPEKPEKAISRKRLYLYASILVLGIFIIRLVTR